MSTVFIDYLHELLAPLGDVHMRRMFGGYGVFRNGVMFGLVDDDTLYLKVDPETEQAFIDAGTSPFEYVKKGKPVRMSYYLAPAELLEDGDQLCAWARRAYSAAMRAAAGGRKKAIYCQDRK